MAAEDIALFLATSPIFSELPQQQLQEIAKLFRSEKYSVGKIILRQGGKSESVCFLRSGQLAVRIQRAGWRETIAYLQPPDIFGELSFITGKPCVADVEVLVDAEILLFDQKMVEQLPQQREAILRSLMRVIAGRLQQTVSQGARVRETPVVLLRNGAHWEAPRCFGFELARSLARQTARRTLLVELGAAKDSELHDAGERFVIGGVAERESADALRAELARRLTEWKPQFENIVLNTLGKDPQQLAGAAGHFSNWTGWLLGPGETAPSESGAGQFVVQSSENPTLAVLRGNCQLIREAQQSEAEHAAGRPALQRFTRTVDSMARCIAGQQVGLALGGGAAWGWAHIGVLSVLEEAGVPIDVLSGCSMGSLIGALYAAGYSPAELEQIAERHRKNTSRYIEWRMWKMCLINEKKIRKVFRHYFHGTDVNRTERPYWANAVDIRTGKEYSIQTGSLIECVRSSIALPGLLPPASRNSHLLVDAGILDPVPVRLVRRMGCHFAIGVNAMAKLEARQVSTRYPLNAIDVMTRSMMLMGHEIGQARAETANVVFTPDLGDVSMLQFSRSPEIIAFGRRAAEEHLPEILRGYEQLKQMPAALEPVAEDAQRSNRLAHA